MAVSSTTAKVLYSGDDGTTVFPFTFKIFASTDLVVTLVGSDGAEAAKSITTHYTVSSSGNDFNDGGNVTMLTAPATGETLSISRDLPNTQTTDYVEGDAFPAESHEDALDKLTLIVQEMQEELSRAVKIPLSDSSDITTELPVSALRQGRSLVSDADGNITTGSVTTAAVSDFMRTVLDDDSAATARATMGAGGSVNLRVDENISIREVVGFRREGKIMKGAGWAGDAASVAITNSLHTVANGYTICPITDTTFYIAYIKDGTTDLFSRVITDNNPGASLGSETEASDGYTHDGIIDSLKLTSTKIVIADVDDNEGFRSKFATISAGAPSYSGASHVATPGSASHPGVGWWGDSRILGKIDDNKFVHVYTDSGSQVDAAVVTASGVDPDYGDAAELFDGSGGAATQGFEIAMLTSSTFIVVGTDGGNDIDARAGTISGTTITTSVAETEIAAQTAAFTHGPFVIRLSDTHALIAYDLSDTSNSVQNGYTGIVTVVVSVSGTTITVHEETRRYASAEPDPANGWSLLDLGSGLFAILRDRSGIGTGTLTGFVAEINKWDGQRLERLGEMDVNPTGMAATVGWLQAAHIGNGRYYSIVRDGGGDLRLIGMTIAGPPIGVATSAISSGQSGPIMRSGVVSGFSGLTVGAPQYSTVTGSIVENPGAGFRIGTAVSATEILVNL